MSIRELSKQFQEASLELDQVEKAGDEGRAAELRRARANLSSELSQQQPARSGEWFDSKQGLWVSAAGYEVCQDHTGPRQGCPYKHGGRHREQ